MEKLISPQKFIDIDRFQQTICASATAITKQAISIIRVSGMDAYKVVGKIFNKDIKFQSGYTLRVGKIYAMKDKVSYQIDEVVLGCYREPNSFTGEDLIEINCHGNPIIVQKIIELLTKNGAKRAKRGEFALRGVINKKISLIQAENINDLINSENEAEAELNVDYLDARHTNFLKKIENSLNSYITRLEMEMNFPEHLEGDSINIEKIIDYLRVVRSRLSEIILYSKKLNMTVKKRKLTIGLAGEPNTGKSSLFNCIVGENRVIVSKVAGTTRDIVDYQLPSSFFDNHTIQVYDTAGIREVKGQIEKEAIERSLVALKKSDLVILVIDLKKLLTQKNKIKKKGLLRAKNMIKKILRNRIATNNKRFAIVGNKVDLFSNHINLKEIYAALNLPAQNPFILTSALRCKVGNLVKFIKSAFKEKSKDDSSLFVARTERIFFKNSWVIEILEEVERKVATIIQDKTLLSSDLLADYLEKIVQKLRMIMGMGENEKIVKRIFRDFCIGK